MAGIKQILFCHKKHKFQEKNAGAKLVLVSVFLVRSNTVRVGVDDLIKQNGCLCCCVVILWKFTGKGESVVPQGKEKFPFQRIIRLKRNKFEDNGHYPTFDLFKFYYVIVDNYTKEIQYISDEIYVTDKYALTVEDRNNDGISELYIDYFKDGKFTVDERGYNLRTTRCYDRIEWSPESEKFNPQQP